MTFLTVAGDGPVDGEYVLSDAGVRPAPCAFLVWGVVIVSWPVVAFDVRGLRPTISGKYETSPLSNDCNVDSMIKHRL